MISYEKARSTLLASGLALLVGTAAVAAVAPMMPPEPEEYDEFEIFIEINATDMDAGLQGFLDGPGWKKTKVLGPGEEEDDEGETVFKFKTDGALEAQGVTEVKWESAEPTFGPGAGLEEFLERFPAGEYTAEGRTIDGGRLEGCADLNHYLPAAPVITSHEDGDEVELDGSNLTLTWEKVTDDFLGGPLDPEAEIVMYVIEVEFEEEVGDEEIKRVLTIDVDPDVCQADIPADFLEPDNIYKIEIGAMEAEGNTTFTEIEICTGECPDDD